MRDRRIQDQQGEPESKPPRGRGRLAYSLQAQSFLAPILLVFLVLIAVPLAQTIYYSFTDFTGYGDTGNFVGLKNYRYVFRDPAMLQGLAFTVTYALATTALIAIVAIPLAVALNNRFPGRNFARAMLFFLSVPSLAILGSIWKYIFSPLPSGALNTVLESLFGMEPQPWLSLTLSARICIIGVAVWAGMGWHAMLYLAYLQSISQDLYEQARVDGASALQQFWNITMPQLVPAVGVSTFLLLTAGLKVYDLPLVLTKGGPGNATQTITQAIVVQGISQGRYGVGSALATMFILVVAAIVLSWMFISSRVEERYS